MAFSYSSHPTRSISLPSRLEPINSFKIDETVKKLKKSCDLSSTSTSGCSIGAETIQDDLVSLVELYNHVRELIGSPSTQQALLRQDRGKLVEEALEGSVGLLDLCSTARDLILRLKEEVQDLQSALRRKRCSSIESELSVYLSFRRKVSKDVVRCLKVLKQSETKYGFSAALVLDLDPCLVMVTRALREVYGVTVGVLRSLLMFLSTPTKVSGWSLFSKLVNKRSGVRSNKSEEIFNEVAIVDLALHNFDYTSEENVQLVRGRLHALDASIQILEGELELVLKRLVEHRVSLLNILTHTM